MKRDGRKEGSNKERKRDGRKGRGNEGREERKGGRETRNASI